MSPKYIPGAGECAARPRHREPYSTFLAQIKKDLVLHHRLAGRSVVYDPHTLELISDHSDVGEALLAAAKWASREDGGLPNVLHVPERVR